LYSPNWQLDGIENAHLQVEEELVNLLVIRSGRLNVGHVDRLTVVCPKAPSPEKFSREAEGKEDCWLFI
jgi:hypothetical protein